VVRHGCGDDLQFYCFQCSRFSPRSISEAFLSAIALQ
jgi:hypothetical protein